MSAVLSLYIRDARSDYAEFFVSEREPKTDGSGRPNYSATWCCYSSFGVYGHYWHAMGEPFALFVQDIERDYLLGKIAKKVTSGERALESVRYSINSKLEQSVITKATAREALRACKEIEDEYSDEEIPTTLFQSVPISKCRIDWCDIETQVWDRQAVGFAERLWPLFVAELKRLHEAKGALVEATA